MYVTRLNQKIIYRAFDNPFITLLIGPRRVGKTYLVQHYVGQNPARMYVSLNLDDLDTRTQIEKDQLAILIEKKLGTPLGKWEGRVFVLIDEAQKAPLLFEQIKILYDRFKNQDKIKFILTGSGALSLHHHAAETLAGRVFIYSLFPFYLEEAFHLRTNGDELIRPFTALMLEKKKEQLGDMILSLQPKREPLTALIHDQLIWGGFPEVLELTQEGDRKNYLSSYRQTYLEKDICALDQVGDLKSFNQLLELVASQVSSLRQDKRLYEILGISAVTFKKYLSILESTFIYFELPPFIYSSLRRLVKAPKAYLSDNGLLSYLRGLYDLEVLIKTGSIGAWFENWVIGSIRAIFSQSDSEAHFFYWRTSGHVEVDLVVQHEGQIIPIEIKYGKEWNPQMIKHLKEFLRQEKQAEYGIVIYQGDYVWNEKDKILFFPVWALM